MTQLHVRTNNRYYLQAAGGGGGEVSARGPWPREHETFTLVAADGRYADLVAGRRVRLRTWSGQFVTASGADGALSATTTDPAAPGAIFTLVLADGEPSRVEHLTRFGLKAANGRFVCAENGGGDIAHANRTVMGPWETFEAWLHPETSDSVLTTGIRTVTGVHWLQAVNGGAAELTARGPWAREWETFDIVAADRNGRGLPDGCPVHVRTSSWHYLQAENGGGGKVTAVGPWPREWETFTLVVPGRRPWLRPGGSFALRAANGRFVEAEKGGGAAVTATATTMTAAATFTATSAPERSNVPVQMLTGTAAREDSTTSTQFTELRPTPGQNFPTARKATITAVLTAEARVETPGATLHAQVIVDGKVAHPGPIVLASESRYATVSLLAFLPGVEPGWHTVTTQWRVSAGRGFVRNRSFTVVLVE